MIPRFALNPSDAPNPCVNAMTLCVINMYFIHTPTPALPKNLPFPLGFISGEGFLFQGVPAVAEDRETVSFATNFSISAK